MKWLPLVVNFLSIGGIMVQNWGHFGSKLGAFWFKIGGTEVQSHGHIGSIFLEISFQIGGTSWFQQDE